MRYSPCGLLASATCGGGRHVIRKNRCDYSGHSGRLLVVRPLQPMHSDLLKSIGRSHAPCRHFGDVCTTMRWRPEAGHVPRGFCGATGGLDEVRLILVTAEPGDPLRGEAHSGDSLTSAISFSFGCLTDPATPFHRNVRLILDLCFPGESLESQFRKTWITNAVLCSAPVESGPVPTQVERTCVGEYLREQISLMPWAMVAALGGKAQRRLQAAGVGAFPALHPSCRESTQAKRASWEQLAARLREWPNYSSGR